MADHYYTNQPSTAHDRKIWDTQLREQKFRFVSEAGVFAKGGVDYGSRVLIEVIDIPAEAQVLDVGCGFGLETLRLADRTPICVSTNWISAERFPDAAAVYERLRSSGEALSMRKLAERSEIYPVFHDLFQKRQNQEAAP